MELTLEQQRQQRHLEQLQSATELTLGNEEGLPWRIAELAAITGREPFVVATIDSGLTAKIYHLRSAGGDFALKLARTECLVRNVDGHTSFLNELICRQRIDFMRADTNAFAAVTKTYAASLRQGVLLTEWVDGESIQHWDRRRLQQLFAAGCELLQAGMFEWDFCPGNLLDDGERIRLFDFGYMYVFDPLRQFNSAGNGDSQPMFHLAERFETRNYFAYLLQLEIEQGMDAALSAFRLEKEVALEAYQSLRHQLLQRGATAMIADWLQAIVTRWSDALTHDLYSLYLQEGWRSHVLDLDDDLRGKTCTPTTLQRGEWLLHALQHHHDELRALDAFFWQDRERNQQQLVAAYREHLALARRYQIDSALRA
jgi:hypothetical protein